MNNRRDPCKDFRIVGYPGKYRVIDRNKPEPQTRIGYEVIFGPTSWRKCLNYYRHRREALADMDVAE